MEAKYVILAGTIVLHDGKILLTQRSLVSKFMPGAWGIPSGKVEYDEDAEQTALRELQQETSLTGRIVKLVGTSKFTGTAGGVKIHNVQLNYLVRVDTADVVIDSSSNDFKWVPVGEIYKIGLDEFTEGAIRQADDFFNALPHPSAFLQPLIRELDKLNWNDLKSCFEEIGIVLGSFYTQRDNLKAELLNYSQERYSETIANSHDLTSHFKWFMYKSKKFGYSIWINQYKEKRMGGFANSTHDHRYWFSSLILKGGFEHDIHGRLSERNFTNEDAAVTEKVFIRPGDSYTVDPDTVHSFNSIEDKTVTLLIRSRAVKNYSVSFDLENAKINKHPSLNSRFEQFKAMLDND